MIEGTGNKDTSIWKELVTRELCPENETYQRFLKRIEQEDLTRDENPASHFCVYFLPVNEHTKKVFIVHHKKSGLWLSPGGHLDKGESPMQAVNREILEELGIPTFFQETPKPFLFSIVDIDHQNQTCKAHHDLWYRMPTDGTAFRIDSSEFHETRWVTIPEARKLMIDKSNLQALDRVEMTLS